MLVQIAEFDMEKEKCLSHSFLTIKILALGVKVLPKCCLYMQIIIQMSLGDPNIAKENV